MAVEIGAPARRAVLKPGHGDGFRIGSVHLGRQRLELRKRDVAGAAFRRRLAPGGGVGLNERHGAFCGKGRQRQDVGCGVQVALRMPADQLPVFRERHVAFDDAGAHPRRRLIGLPGVLGELQRRAAMADGKIGLVKGPGALAQFLFQRPVLHPVDEVKGPGTDLRL
jgi:hypothetical protein